MIRTAALASAALLLAAAPAMAQASKVEISGNVGWVISDGVTGSAVKAQDGNVYDELDAKDAMGYHFTFGLHASPALEVGFLYGRQQSKLQAKGTKTLEIGDMNIDSYHVYFAYNFGSQSAKVKPFIYGGLGSTKYGDVNFDPEERHQSHLHRPHDSRPDALLDHVGRRRKGLPGEGRGLQGRDAVGADLHQERRGRLVVRPVLGLLRRRQRAVLEPARLQRRLTVRF